MTSVGPLLTLAPDLELPVAFLVVRGTLTDVGAELGVAGGLPGVRGTLSDVGAGLGALLGVRGDLGRARTHWERSESVCLPLER